jgi:hypothetical protein
MSDFQPEEPDWQRAVEKWTLKYSAEVAEQLIGRVEDGMPHYEYMVQYKL